MKILFAFVGCSVSFGALASADPAVCDHSYDCGHPGITKAECEAKNCCFDDDGTKPLQCSGFLQNCSTTADCNSHGECISGACKCTTGYAGAYCNQTALPPFPDIKTVHVINSCHLDIGFADSSAGIINSMYL